MDDKIGDHCSKRRKTIDYDGIGTTSIARQDQSQVLMQYKNQASISNQESVGVDEQHLCEQRGGEQDSTGNAALDLLLQVGPFKS